MLAVGRPGFPAGLGFLAALGFPVGLPRVGCPTANSCCEKYRHEEGMNGDSEG